MWYAKITKDESIQLYPPYQKVDSTVLMSCVALVDAKNIVQAEMEAVRILRRPTALAADFPPVGDSDK